MLTCHDDLSGCLWMIAYCGIIRAIYNLIGQYFDGYFCVVCCAHFRVIESQIVVSDVDVGREQVS